MAPPPSIHYAPLTALKTTTNYGNVYEKIAEIEIDVTVVQNVNIR